VLRIIDQIESDTRKAPVQYPSFITSLPELGMTVGYMAWLRKPNQTGRSVFTYFSSAQVSYRGECENGDPRWILSGGFVEPGFSGGPAFLRDGTLIGVVVGSTAMVQNPSAQGVPPIWHSFPQVSPIQNLGQSLTDEIRQAASI
jgi:hypothetical protein